MKTLIYKFNELDTKINTFWNGFDQHWLNTWKEWKAFNRQIALEKEEDRKERARIQRERLEQLRLMDMVEAETLYLRRQTEYKKPLTELELLQKQNDQLKYIRWGMAGIFLFVVVVVLF